MSSPESQAPLPGWKYQEGNYWQESKGPLISLAFVAPMLLIYELGAYVAGPQALRNGADVWLRELLQFVGFGHYLLLPVLTAGILLAWHHTTREPWKIREELLGIMFLEASGWALLLLGVARMLGMLFAMAPGLEIAPPAAMGSLRHLAGELVGPFGAGIYEELLFRLMLFPLLLVCLQRGLPLFWQTDDKQPGRQNQLDLISYGGAILLTSLLFSAAHYQVFTSHGDAFELYSFTFRTLAGVFFCLLFVSRGFGIAVGAHAMYDVFVSVLRLVG
ncbi:CPBP family intramembrane glutamic endopeptidase [Lignipirellula cremea]|uniref:CAAX amino terminal protease self-immunity n=1 Tax=Lignipirellula cremea TaxID=2528010 RepID=A0A518E3U4_9BACT|nr:CPBP family intramembrane glutamic endopeptidase [Lignipirellula cremea]QDU98761.1 CAAX amino terminal protease self- immunity [Lignipirellula cremea]